mmetsp:Transcript_21420/g.24617  ORF Transcript_21420/g.24617 Transcript_21420/m.24617 type:complete len:80 (+) Transcript_21420:302-541(+)
MQQYIDTIYLQFFIDSIAIWVFTIMVSVTLIILNQKRVDMMAEYSTITTLKAQTQTTAVLSQIETAYSNLDSYGYSWFE